MRPSYYTPGGTAAHGPWCQCPHHRGKQITTERCAATGGVLYGDDVRCELPAGHAGNHYSSQEGELRW